MMNRQRTYWWCQGCGWLAYAVVGLTIGFAFQSQSWRYALAAFVNAAAGLALTHMWRNQMRARGWMQRALRALIPRLLGSGVLLATLWMFISVIVSYGLFGEWLAGAVALAMWFNWNMALLVWALLYGGWHFIERSQEAEIQKWRLEAMLKETELNALKAQLNPHFLFNALNSIRALIVEDPARGQAAVTQLANILRYSLRVSALTPLHTEMQLVRDYLALEKIRFDERLTVQMQFDEAALSCAVPPMIVQTLVENGIKHGIALRQQGGTIAVRAWVEHERLRIQVSNDGRLDASPTTTQLGWQNATAQLGWQNAIERLQLLYGAQAVLTLTASGDDQVTADLTLPRQTNN